MPDLQDQVALITGAARMGGLGRAFALELARLGAHVVVSDMPGASADLTDKERTIGWRGLASIVDEVRQLGRRSLEVDIDVTQPDSVDRSVALTIAEFGRLDILVNNAGISRTGKPLQDVTDAEWTEVIDIDLNGVFRCCRAVIPHMIEGGRGGRIISVASSAARLAPANYGAYPAAKAGIAALMRMLARELAPHGITANAISPGPIGTDRMPLVYSRMAEQSGLTVEEVEQRYLSQIPLGRLGTPAEIAALVGFLAGPNGAWITGQEILPNGGWIMP